jgi:hypothetical protein
MHACTHGAEGAGIESREAGQDPEAGWGESSGLARAASCLPFVLAWPHARDATDVLLFSYSSSSLILVHTLCT